MRNINLTIDEERKQYNIEDNSSGISLEDVAKEFSDKYPGYITLGVIGNKLKELNHKISMDCNIKFLDTTNADGLRVYSRTMSFIFIMACNELFEGSRVTIEHSLSNGLYCEVHMGESLSEKDVCAIKQRMIEIVKNNYNIDKISTDRKEGIEIFENYGMYEKAQLLKYKEYDDVKIYKCNQHINHFYGYMLPSTGYIKTFDLKLYNNGVIVLGPSEEDKTIPAKFK